MRLLPTVSIVLLTGSVLALIRYASYEEESDSNRARTRTKRSSKEIKKIINVTDRGRGGDGDKTHLSLIEAIDEEGKHNHSSQNRFKRSLFSLDEESRKTHLKFMVCIQIFNDRTNKYDWLDDWQKTMHAWPSPIQDIYIVNLFFVTFHLIWSKTLNLNIPCKI